MLPKAFLARMEKLLGPEFPAFLASYDRPRNVGLRVNPLKTDAVPDLGAYGLEPVPWEPRGYYYDLAARPGLSPYHEAGLYYLQEPSAMAPAGLLDVRPGMRVLDLCAAPGGKSTQLAAALQGQGKILARNFERLAVANGLVLNEHPQRLAERFPRYFDRILVDAPCSGEGMFRKEEAALTDWSEETVAMCAGRQYEILCSAAAMLAPGGRLVYSTCTFAPAENEGVVNRFLHSHLDFAVVPADAPWFVPGENGSFRLWPHKLLGEGHFAAVLKKQDGEIADRISAPGEKPPAQWDSFARPLGIRLPEGKAMSFGQTLYWVPEEMPPLKGLKVLRPGLELGTVKKDRFEPAHALALWLKECGNVQSFEPESREIQAYLHGDVVPSEKKGWCLVQAGQYSIGWGKGDGTVLKNHYPKGLRR